MNAQTESGVEGWTDEQLATAWKDIHELQAELEDMGSTPPITEDHRERRAELKERTTRILADLRMKTPERRSRPR